ncbi:MAG: aminotransferase class III-fold pyridoxal phosphate-dependent enzyme, partial [Sporomusaceae bacterium]|nr:aminotransferase class III-fold pyridoxal phosphate-dependent enzyme [Sporomusaceae bacterium]
HVPAPGYLEGVRKLCDKYGALLIFDEIQCGMGRTGELFAYQYYKVQPDIATLAKGLGGGVPMGAFMTTDKIAAAFTAGDHGTTFGGNPLVCAASLAVFKAIDEEHILDNAKKVGDYMKAQLLELKKAYPKLIKEVRGEGLMLGAELTKPGREIVEACLNKGVIINCTAGNVLRFVPPLIITESHVDEVMTVLKEVLQSEPA